MAEPSALQSFQEIRFVVRDVARHWTGAVVGHPRTVLAAAFGVAGAAGLIVFLRTRNRVLPEEQERLRRAYLCAQGRLSDGVIVDTAEAGISSMLVYQYRIAGVDYECSQDLSMLPEHMGEIRVDLPIQVRYDPRNPGNSIVAAEGWSGLQYGTVYSGVFSQQAEEN